MEGGVRSDTREQDEFREHSVPELVTEEDAGGAEEKMRAAKPLGDPRCPTAGERAIHDAFICHSFSGSPSVMLAA